MLKGLKGILEKGLQIAAPFLGAALPGPFGGAIGSALGGGIASLLTGNKPKDALMSAGISALAATPFGKSGKSIFERVPQSFTPTRIIENLPSGVSETFDKMIDKGEKTGSGFIDFLGKKSKDDGPTYGAKLLATGLPAILSYMAAVQDAKKAGPQDASEYMSAVDKFYGGQFAPPPEDRLIQNLDFQGFVNDEPVYANQGGIMNAQQPVQYSAMTGEGIMGMADGGDVFPRRTGAISGPGTKTSDSIPAMLSDGEFVQRTDAVNGAGVMMGATNAKEAREKGADFMYALQDKLAKLGQKVA